MAAPTISEAELRGQESTGDREGYDLLVVGSEHTASTPLPDIGEVLIGRHEGADIRLIDPMASRNHARLHVGSVFEVEDLGSGNGTVLRDKRLAPNQRMAIEPGEAITIGSTVLIVQRRRRAFRPRQMWPHGYFETRLIEECARGEQLKKSFAVLRLHVGGGADPGACERLLSATARSGDVLALYGPGEYELLLVDSSPAESDAVRGQLLQALERSGMKVRTGLAGFPEDGISPQALVSQACARLRGGGDSEARGSVVLENPAMRALYAIVDKVAPGAINVLITGETGAGKEILAQTVHRRSRRAEQPFVGFNCAALSESLLESELFGFEKGAFTGAVQAKPGLLEAASGGTLFLDEVGEMSLALQAKVLRAIESREVLRVGATRPRAVDVRFVAATNRDLEEEVAAGRFRQDLYFRLNGITLNIPPLRERVDEIEPLARLFLERAAGQMETAVPSISPEALAMLRAYSWPGNIRELRNVMERALLLASGAPIAVEHLPAEKMTKRPLVAVSSPSAEMPAVAPVPAGGAPPAPPPAAGTSMREIERQAILDALARCAGNQTRAAEYLGLPRRTFCTRLREYNIPRPRA
jgi:DNA-binding NtrC family response regulator